jgi:hypothetical protein
VLLTGGRIIEMYNFYQGTSMMPPTSVLDLPRIGVLIAFLTAVVMPFGVVCLGLAMGVFNGVISNLTTNEHFNHNKYGMPSLRRMSDIGAGAGIDLLHRTDYIQFKPRYRNRYDKGALQNCKAFWFNEDLGEERRSMAQLPLDEHIV